jgi:hypothetical protein
VDPRASAAGRRLPIRRVPQCAASVRRRNACTGQALPQVVQESLDFGQRLVGFYVLEGDLVSWCVYDVEDSPAKHLVAADGCSAEVGVALDLHPPEADRQVAVRAEAASGSLHVRRCDLLGGLIHEYDIAAAA